MDMKRERRKVYLRCFALLLGLWLALAGVFSAYVLQSARSQERDRFIQAADDLAAKMRSSSASEIKRTLDATERYGNEYSLKNYQEALKTEREWFGSIYWTNLVRLSETQSGVTAALFTYSGEPSWTVAKPGNVGVVGYAGGNWDVYDEEAHEDRIFNLLDYFDAKDLKAICREMEKPAYTYNARLIMDAYWDGDGYQPLSITARNYSADKKPDISIESNYGTAESREEIRQADVLTSYNAIRAARKDPDARWIQTSGLFSGYELQEFTAMFNGSARLEDIAADPSRLMVQGVDYPQGRSMGDYTVDDQVVQESAWNLLDRVYTAQVGFGSIAIGEDPVTSVVTAHPVYWIQLAGRSDVWSAAGSYWLATVLISLAGFLAAAWLLAYTTWRGQRTHLLYERRTRETTAALAHDLKTPLAVIRACAENLSEGVSPEKEGQYTQEITRQTAVMDKSLLDMLELSRVDRPDAPLRLEEISWKELLDGRLEGLKPLLNSLEITVEAAGTVTADRAQLERLADNLLHNALEHSSGTVRIRADERCLRVYNSGPAIPEADLPRIWEPYFKGDAARKGGSGLGLALVATIAKAHGWTCSAENAEAGVEVSILFS